MLDGAAVDVVVGLSFLYFVFAIVASAINEAVASALGWRAKTLRDGIRNLLGGDRDLESDVFEHPLIQALARPSRPSRWRRVAPLRLAETPAGDAYPSYIPARTFAAALVHPVTGAAAAGRMPALVALERQAGGDARAFELSLERWYDDAMERVSGWYRRRVQVWLGIWALALACALNLDTVAAARELYADQTVRDAVVAQAQAAARAGAPHGSALDRIGSDVQQARSLALPLGWSSAAVPRNAAAVFSKLAGLLLTTAALSLGAPFWFDALSKIARLRATGAPPPASDAVRRGEGEELRHGPGTLTGP